MRNLKRCKDFIEATGCPGGDTFFKQNKTIPCFVQKGSGGPKSNKGKGTLVPVRKP